MPDPVGLEGLVGFNDPRYSDWRLEIIVEDSSESLPTERIVLHVNSLMLGKSSLFFRYSAL